jgi:hypothetical protein
MATHGMLEPFDVTLDKKPNAVVACVRFTALIIDGRTVVASPLPVPTLPEGNQTTDERRREIRFDIYTLSLSLLRAHLL